MKLSDAMEKGFAKVGVQYFLHFWPDPVSTCGVAAGRQMPTQCCALGACMVGRMEYEKIPGDIKTYIIRLNDNCRMPIPEIIEVLRGMGL